MKKLKVLMLTSSYPKNEDDNSSIFLKYLAESIADKDIDVTILAPDHADIANRDSDFINHSIKIHHFHYLPKKLQLLAYGSGILPNIKKHPLLIFQIPFFFFSMLFSLINICIKSKPDIIHAHWIIPQGLIAVIVGSILRIPVITTAHGADAYALNNRLLSSIKKYVISKSQIWTSNTASTANVIQMEKSKLVIIPMGVDIQQFSSGDATVLRRNIEEENIILFVGRLVEKKGVRYLIEAFNNLTNSVKSQSKLWIVGSGNELSLLQKIIEDYKLSDYIKFFGDISNKDLPSYYAAADIFVAPSIIDSSGDTEGQGVVLIEALASRTPVISTNTGGIHEVISNNKTGLLVEPAQPEQLAKAIEQLLNNSFLKNKMIKNGFDHVTKTYGWSNIADKFISTYYSVVNK
ncbi:MAG: glycosyltransferase family 4 protein [Gammaproteobacteria bacterium]|nr:glycosyltransferase family 4 protein [Gammaproteobacteria bacterium]